MLSRALYRFGLREAHLEVLSAMEIALCVALWIRAGAVDQAERGNAERRALFVGLWPASTWLVASAVGRQQTAAARTTLRWPSRRC